ncbi:MAG: 2-hydroxyacid dehydrogenase [Candidatus Dormibacteria bacterium]
MADVLCTLPLPEPFPGPVKAVATLRVLGRIPLTAELIADLQGCPADVLCSQLDDPINADVLDAGLPRLRAVCTYAVGTNNIDVAAATERGILVANTPGVLTDATADMAMALLLAAARHVVEGDRQVRAGVWQRWEPGYLLGLDLTGARLGIVGFGRIGQAVARRARAFGMEIATLERSAGRIPDDLRGEVSTMPFDDLIAGSDVVSLHCPLTPETHHLIDAATLARMKPTAVLVNTARGSVVDEMALVRALQEGWISAAGLDVYEVEPEVAPGLAECRNAVLAPHLGSATVQTRAAMAGLVAENALAVLRDELPPHCLNPEAKR